MKKLILSLLLSPVVFWGYGQTNVKTTPAGIGTKPQVLAALGDRARREDAEPNLALHLNGFLDSPFKTAADYLPTAPLPLSVLTQGTGIVAFSYDGSSGATIAVDQSFSPVWTGPHRFSPVVAGTAFGLNLTPAQSASANNQVEVALHIAPTYTDGSFTGAVHTPLLMDWDNLTHFSISDVGGAGVITFHASANPTVTNYFLRSDGTNTVYNAALGGSLFFRINNGNVMTLGTDGKVTFAFLGSGLTYASSGTLNSLANGTANQLLGMNNAGTSYEYKTVNGSLTTGITVATGIGNLTLSADTLTLQTVANFFPKGDTRYLKASSPLSWDKLTGKPTTLSGYGITDATSLAGAQTLTNKTLTAPVITAPLGLVKADVGLANADNTSDLNKPVSTAQSAALALKASDANVVHLTGNENIAGIKTFADKVGFGTATVPSGYQFAFNGNAIATSLTVKLQSNWGDYIFADDYKLAPLSDVAKYISRYHHLPGIPDAGQVARQGIDLGEMNTELVKKVEELTLYLLEKEKQLKAQQDVINAQEERLKRIEKKLQLDPNN